MKIIKKIFREEIIVILATIFAMVLSFYPYVYEVGKVRTNLAEERYPLLFEYDFPPDWRFYISRIREGYEGKWLVTEKYTSEVHSPSVLHIVYLFIGKAARVFSLQPEYAFVAARIVSGIFFIMSAYLLIHALVREKKLRIIAFLLFLFVANIPVLDRYGIQLFGRNLSFVITWNTFFDPGKRLVFLPHYTLANGLLFLGFRLLVRGIKERKVQAITSSGVLLFLASLVLPTVAIFSLGVSAAYIAFSLVAGFSRKTVINEVLKMAKITWPFWVLSLGTLIFLKLATSYFPWNLGVLIDLTRFRRLLTNNEILFGMGIIGPLGLIGALYVIFSKNREYLFPVSWIAALVGLHFFADKTNFFSSQRFYQIDHHVVLAILTVFLLAALEKFLNKRYVFGILAALVFVPSILAWIVSVKSSLMFIDAKIGAGYPIIPQLPYIVYPVRDVMNGVFWLRDNTNHNTVVLSGETLGNMIPAYSGNYVYFGHGNQTVLFDSKKEMVARFFRGGIGEEGAKELVREGRINYIFYGVEERELSQGHDPNYSFLELVYKNPLVKIFKVVI